MNSDLFCESSGADRSPLVVQQWLPGCCEAAPQLQRLSQSYGTHGGKVGPQWRQHIWENGCVM